MIVGRVIGNVWATRKTESLSGLKFMVVEPITYKDCSSQYPIVCADKIGAGIGELVLVVSGSTARLALDRVDAPVDNAIVGIIDDVDLDQ